MSNTKPLFNIVKPSPTSLSVIVLGFVFTQGFSVLLDSLLRKAQSSYSGFFVVISFSRITFVFPVAIYPAVKF
jgi:hypothetical protein